MNQRASWAWRVAIAGGAALWLVVAGLSDRREAWDSSLYWVIAYPLAICLAGGLGYWVPEKPWRWGLTIMLTQAVMLVISGSDFGLLPLGVILFSILALPAMGLGWLMARFRLRSENGHGEC